MTHYPLPTTHWRVSTISLALNASSSRPKLGMCLNARGKLKRGSWYPDKDRIRVLVGAVLGVLAAVVAARGPVPGMNHTQGWAETGLHVSESGTAMETLHRVCMLVEDVQLPVVLSIPIDHFHVHLFVLTCSRFFVFFFCHQRLSKCLRCELCDILPAIIVYR